MADLFHIFTITLLSGCVLGLFMDQRPGLLHRWWLTRSRHDTEHHLHRPERLVGGTGVLFVLDPNFFLCWESVPVDQTSNTTLLPWILGLKDALTRTPDNPDGLDLKIPDAEHSAPEVAGLATFRGLMESAWRDGAANVSLPSNLVLMHQAAALNSSLADLGLQAPGHGLADEKLVIPIEGLLVTSVDNFWEAALTAFRVAQEVVRSMQRWNAAGLLHLRHPVPPSFCGVLLAQPGLNGSVILLPRIVSKVHDSHPVKEAASGSMLMDPLGWDVAQLGDFVRAFMEQTGAGSVPSLEEWAILADKRKLQGMYLAYYEASPARRTPPIPTAFVDTPGTKPELLALCHSAEVISSPAHVETVMAAIYRGIQHLNRQVHILERTRPGFRKVTGMVEPENGGLLREYVIKREFSEGAVVMTSFSFPDVAVQGGEEPWAARPPLPGRVPEQARQSGALMTRPYLQAAAELVAGRSCTEGWLLQPKITDMPDLEYRVYLIGGAAAEGTPGDAVVVYTPSVLQEGIYMANLTLPHGTFWSDVIEPPGGGPGGLPSASMTGGGIAAKLGQERRPWRCPELHAMAVNAALDGARALAAFNNGALSTVAHMFVRVDVVLAVHWDVTGEEMFVVPLINEMDWFNSAAQMIAHWPPAGGAPEEARGREVASWGKRLARRLVAEIARTIVGLARAS